MSTLLDIERDLGLGAVFSPDRRYRYALYRTWDAAKPPTLWVLLNPSTADETKDDPTIRRCIGFSQRWGDGGVIIANLFALRSTDPRALLKEPDPVGRPENDAYISAARTRAARVVVGWGAFPRNGRLRERELEILAKGVLGRPGSILCLGKTAKHGDPRHPLYVRGDTALEAYP